jgi:predicted metal-dependent hydrolase
VRRSTSHAVAPAEPLPAPLSANAFKDEVRAWSERLDVHPAEIHVTPMSRKWASCSSRGRVTFASDLLAQPDPVRREVIVHELLHLKVPNHGPLFRALLSAHLSEGITQASRRKDTPQRSKASQQSAQ